MLRNPLYHYYQRRRTLLTDKIHALPIVVLMPHSACNCRCVMCDIWKDNKNLKQLTEQDISGLLSSLKKLGTRQVLMSGGEALLNPNFFRFCEILKTIGCRVTLLSTGLTLEKNAANIVRHVNDVIVSLDGDESTHDQIRNIPGAFKKMAEGIAAIRSLEPTFKITGRTVIHRLNFRRWPAIVKAAKAIGLNQISFLPADVSSHAFNREVLWSPDRQHEIVPDQDELIEIEQMVEQVIQEFSTETEQRFIAESPAKLRNIYGYYAAYYGLRPFPFKKCNAPWVSAVVEADGTVRPCFFHKSIGNIHDDSLVNILNGETGIRFRKNLDMDSNETCRKCVCYLHLSPGDRIS